MCLSIEAHFTDLEHAEGLGMPSSEIVAKKGFANVERPIEAHIVDSPEARETERRHTYLEALVILPAISDILRV